jgi:hypothetical protein
MAGDSHAHVQPTTYQPASTPAVAKTPSQSPDGAVVNHHQMLALLRESVYAETREWAADNLDHFSWQISPEIADSLIYSAVKDKAATVRMACIRCMVRMNITTKPALDTLKALKADVDPRVQLEAQKALAKLSGRQVASR